MFQQYWLEMATASRGEQRFWIEVRWYFADCLGMNCWLYMCAHPPATMFLVIQLAQQGDTSHDPMALWLVRIEYHGKDEVCRMSGRGQHATTFTCFVNRRCVWWSRYDIRSLHWNEPDLQGAKLHVLVSTVNYFGIKKYWCNGMVLSWETPRVKYFVLVQIWLSTLQCASSSSGFINIFDRWGVDGARNRAIDFWLGVCLFESQSSLLRYPPSKAVTVLLSKSPRNYGWHNVRLCP